MAVPHKCCVGDAQRQSKDTAALAGSCVAQALGTENSCAMGRRFSHGRRTIQKGDNLEQLRPAALPGDLSPVQVVNEVAHIAGQDDPVLPHVPVIPKHTHWNVGRHFRKLSQNIVKCPSSEQREKGR